MKTTKVSVPNSTTNTSTSTTATTKTPIITTQSLPTTATTKRDAKKKKKSEEESQEKKEVYSINYQDDINKLLEYINDTKDQSQSQSNNKSTNNKSKVNNKNTIKSTTASPSNPTNSNAGTTKSKSNNSRKPSNNKKQSSTEEENIDNNVALKPDPVVEVVLEKQEIIINPIIEKQPSIEFGFSIDEIEFLDYNTEFYNNINNSINGSNASKEFVTVKGKKTRKLDKKVDVPQTVQKQQGEKIKPISQINKSDNKIFNQKNINNDKTINQRHQSQNASNKELSTTKNKQISINRPESHKINEKTNYNNKNEIKTLELNCKNNVKSEESSKQKSGDESEEIKVTNQSQENQLFTQNHPTVSVQNKITNDEKLPSTKTQKDVLVKKNSTKSVIFLDENPNTQDESKSAKSSLIGIRFGFGTSDSESEDQHEDQINEMNGSKNKDSTSDGIESKNLQQQQISQMQPLICVTHPSSIHPYFTASYPICYPSMPVFYINQAQINANSQDTENKHIITTNELTNTHQPPTLVAFAAPPSSTNASISTNNATLTPIMSVLPPMENQLSINQYCITTTSNNSNNILIYDQHYHKVPEAVITVTQNKPTSDEIINSTNISSKCLAFL